MLYTAKFKTQLRIVTTTSWNTVNLCNCEVIIHMEAIFRIFYWACFEFCCLHYGYGSYMPSHRLWRLDTLLIIANWYLALFSGHSMHCRQH